MSASDEVDPKPISSRFFAAAQIGTACRTVTALEFVPEQIGTHERLVSIMHRPAGPKGLSRSW